MDYINSTEAAIIDKNSVYFGVNLKVLMKNAGRAVFEELEKIMDGKEKIAIICGRGNNGGDGFVLARLLHEKGYTPQVYMVGNKDHINTPEARSAFMELEDGGVDVLSVGVSEEIDLNVDVIVDGMLGTGIRGEPKEPFSSIIKSINNFKGVKVSIDVPSGLGSGTEVKSDLVVALHRAKIGLEPFKTVVKDIGVPSKATTNVGPGDLVANIKRDTRSHKGDNGRVLVIGGGRDYYGAPILSAMGALASGCDLVTLLVPETNFDVTRSQTPDFIVKSYNGTDLNKDASEKAQNLFRTQNVCVLGPGLGDKRSTREVVGEILSKIEIPVVIDADALKNLKPNELVDKRTVITPHVGEFEALTGEELPAGIEWRKKAVKKWASSLNTTILLKSTTDIIASPEGKVKVNETGNPGMTVGGTGDVLAGVVGGYLSQGMSTFAAATCAAFVNGVAGDSLYNFKGYAFTASDLAGEIPFTVKRILDLYS